MTTYEDLPPRKNRRLPGGPDLCTISVDIRVVTPILGGGVEARTLDDTDVIRPSTVRGHLRFWWRALQGHEYETPKELFDAESRLWGKAAEDTGRSAVNLRIMINGAGGEDDSDIDLRRTPGAYALWPARGESKTGKPPAPRRKAGTEFNLTLVAPKEFEETLLNVIRAWILFGGYGSRTRRGLGSLTAMAEQSHWLPLEPTLSSFNNLFKRELFTLSGTKPGDMPWLAGASFHVAPPVDDAETAWTIALAWLWEFRQGTAGGPGERAREPGTGKQQPNRPSWSNWPEPDKIRHLMKRTRTHPPRHNAELVWPRAGFGLPIIGQFQSRARDGNRLDEPGPFELRWRLDRNGEEGIDRLASPLIVKALPLATGRYAPCALWLARAYPPGEVFLSRVNTSGAPFDRLVANGDQPQFNALAGKTSLRNAFLHWLQHKQRTTVLVP